MRLATQLRPEITARRLTSVPRALASITTHPIRKTTITGRTMRRQGVLGVQATTIQTPNKTFFSVALIRSSR